MRRVFFSLVALFSMVSFAFVEEEKITIYDVKVEDKKALTLTEEFSFYKEDLIGGRINIKGYAKSKEAEISKVEISTDGGRSWKEAEGTQAWQFSFYPDEGLHKIKFLVSDKKGNMQTLGDLKITYTKFKPEEAILSLLKKIEESYEQENLERFILCFSESRYPNYIKFREAILRDFQYFRNIRVFKRIEHYNISDDQKQAFYDVLWKTRYTDIRDNSKARRSSLISMHLTKEDGIWKVASLKNNNVFGTTLLANIDLTLGSSDISTDYKSITATIRNNGSEEARGVKVRFYIRPEGEISYNFLTESTLNIISARGSANSTVSATVSQGDAIKVIIDETNTIVETNETNNSATRSF